MPVDVFHTNHLNTLDNTLDDGDTSDAVADERKNALLRWDWDVKIKSKQEFAKYMC